MTDTTRRNATPRALHLFEEQARTIALRTDRWFAAALAGQWGAGILVALTLTPRSWQGTVSLVHTNVVTAALLGGLLSAFPIALVLLRPGARGNRYVIACAQMLWSSLLIHLTGGRLETHFHIFGSLAFLAMYRDWRVLVPATLIVAVDHFLRGLFWPQSVFGFSNADWWGFLEYSFWLLFEGAFLVVAIRQSVREMWAIATRQGDLEAAKASVDAEVAARTDALRKSEEALKSNLALLSATLEATVDGILVVDGRSRPVSFNSRFVDMWKIPEAVIVTRDDNRFLVFAQSQVADPGAFLAGVSALYAAPAAEAHDLLRLKDGRVFERHTKPHRVDGEIVGRVWSFRDTTEREKAEQALIRSQEQFRQSQKMEAIGRLAGGIAHDFNNMLSVIIGYSDLAQMNVNLDRQTHGFIGEIRSAGKRAASLTSQLLAFSRRQILNPVVLELNAGVRELDKMLKRLIGEDITLDMSLAPELGLVKADPGQIQQVIMNLVVNARDAINSGGRIVLTTASVVLEQPATWRDEVIPPGHYVTLAVSDNGSGMTAEVQAHLFEPFFTTKGQGKGTGLGLSTVYGIVKQSGGYLLVDSAPGRGTTFTIHLPAVSPELEPSIQAKSEYRRSSGSETLLLVEDEELLRKLGADVLTMNGYTVLQANNGKTGLELYQRESARIDMVITDVVMPVMGGRSMADEIRKIRPDAQILFMTGYTDDVVLHHGIQTGEVPILPKPFSPMALTHRIREMLDERKRGRRVGST